MKLQFALTMTFLLLLLSAFQNWAFAQEDCEGCKEHPMFTRMPNFFQTEYTSNFDALEVYVAQNETKSVEGQRTHMEFLFNHDSGLQHPSALQVKRNFQNAAKKIGAKVMYEDDYMTTMLLNKAGKESWIKLDVTNDGGYYYLDILEVEAMEQEITAHEMLDALNKEGFMALYLNFDTGKSLIKEESQPVVEQIAALMQQNPELKISVEGHTDNVGDAAANKKLSQQRAKAVSDALLAKGIAANRLSSAAWGSENPIADNRSEEGKALNRRVEIVKK